jgi:hypothetical protein
VFRLVAVRNLNCNVVFFIPYRTADSGVPDFAQNTSSFSDQYQEGTKTEARRLESNYTSVYKTQARILESNYTNV